MGVPSGPIGRHRRTPRVPRNLALRLSTHTEPKVDAFSTDDGHRPLVFLRLRQRRLCTRLAPLSRSGRHTGGAVIHRHERAASLARTNWSTSAPHACVESTSGRILGALAKPLIEPKSGTASPRSVPASGRGFAVVLEHVRGGMSRTQASTRAKPTCGRSRPHPRCAAPESARGADARTARSRHGWSAVSGPSRDRRRTQVGDKDHTSTTTSTGTTPGTSSTS